MDFDGNFFPDSIPSYDFGMLPPGFQSQLLFSPPMVGLPGSLGPRSIPPFAGVPEQYMGVPLPEAGFLLHSNRYGGGPYQQKPQQPRPQFSQVKSTRGSWVCPVCSNLNFATRTQCNMRSCGAPKPPDAGSVCECILK